MLHGMLHHLARAFSFNRLNKFFLGKFQGSSRKFYCAKTKKPYYNLQMKVSYENNSYKVFIFLCRDLRDIGCNISVNALNKVRIIVHLTEECYFSPGKEKLDMSKQK